MLTCGNQQVEGYLMEMLEGGNYEGEAFKELISQAGQSQGEMNQLLSYIDSNRNHGTPVKDWPSTPQLLQEDEESINYLDFDEEIVQQRGPKRKRQKMDSSEWKMEASEWKMDSSEWKMEEQMESSERKQSKARTRMRKKELPEVHLPSEAIYLQRLSGTRDVQKTRAIRTKKRKTDKPVQRFMDEENEIYDLDF